MTSRQRDDFSPALHDAVARQIGNGQRLTDWLDDEHCAFRCIEGTDPDRGENRVAFIEKTPRVRIAPMEEGCINDGVNWEQGPKGCAPEYGRYPPSREWCDEMLTAMGYDLTDKA